MRQLHRPDNSLIEHLLLPWATREAKPVDRYINESSYRKHFHLTKSDGMKQEIF